MIAEDRLTAIPRVLVSAGCPDVTRPRVGPGQQ
jgi:hypothetical protein